MSLLTPKIIDPNVSVNNRVLNSYSEVELNHMKEMEKAAKAGKNLKTVKFEEKKWSFIVSQNKNLGIDLVNKYDNHGFTKINLDEIFSTPHMSQKD